jgi:hypothetical protein
MIVESIRRTQIFCAFTIPKVLRSTFYLGRCLSKINVDGKFTGKTGVSHYTLEYNRSYLTREKTLKMFCKPWRQTFSLNSQCSESIKDYIEIFYVIYKGEVPYFQFKVRILRFRSSIDTYGLCSLFFCIGSTLHITTPETC